MSVDSSHKSLRSDVALAYIGNAVLICLLFEAAISAVPRTCGKLTC
jgi:hypothetical protein